MEYRVLGSLEVLAASGEKLALGGAMQQSVLASLLLRAGQTVALERLVDDLWDEPPETAARTVQTYVSRLRHELPRDAIESRPGGYRLVLNGGELDLEMFKRRAEEGRRALAAGRYEEAGRLLRSGLALWRGPPLAGLTSDALRGQAERLEELRVTALEDRLEADLGCDREAEIVPELKTLVAEHPFRERLRAQLMRALYRSGRPGEALALYRETRRLLVDELGMEPGQELRELEQAILRQDAELEAPRLRRSTGSAAPVSVEREPRIEQPAAREVRKAVTTLVCRVCGETNAASARFCQACGTTLGAPPAAHEVRKTVTILFADVAGSTSLGERLDPEALRSVMSRYFDEMREVLERHGGTVEKFIGDAVMAVFGVPVVHEDDALRAVRAASEMLARLKTLNKELTPQYGTQLEMRIGVNTGPVVAGDPSNGQTLVTGDTVNLAKRLEQAAPDGSILIGKATYPLVKDAVHAGPLQSFKVKGKADPVSPLRLDSVDPHAAGVARRLDRPFVGRLEELEALRIAFRRVEAERSCRLFTVLGTAGIGKSRLVAEFIDETAATVLAGRCLPYGEGISLWPFREIIRGLGGAEGLAQALAGAEDAEFVIERLMSAVGATPGTVSAGETPWAFRRLLEKIAERRPVVVVLEDIHWGAPVLLDVIEYLLGWLRGPVFLVCLARPDLLDLRPGWVNPRRTADVLIVDALAADEAESLLSELRTTPEARAQIAEAAEGNPLFLEQMTAMLAEQGDVGVAGPVPPTIHALLAARLDQLSRVERAVVERAAVVGREFPRAAVTALSPPELEPALAGALMALVRKELLVPETSSRQDDVFRFGHILIRDAAYDAVPKMVRAELHEQLARWLDERETAPEEIVGYHLEQAHQARVQLGLFDDRTRELGGRASTLLASAGRRALDLGDFPAAAALFGRASTLLPPDHPDRRALAPDHATALIAGGDLTAAERLLTGAVEAAGAARERGVKAHALVVLANLRFATQPTNAVSEAERVAEQTIRTFSRLGDGTGLAHAWRLLAYADATRGRWSTTADRLQKAMAHAEEAGDRRTQEAVLSFLPLAFLYGPMPVDEAIRRCEEIHRGANGNRLLEAGVAALLAPLLAMRGRHSEARELSEQSTTLLEDLGAVALLANARAHRAHAEVLAGRPGEAERDLRSAHETFAMIGDKVNAAAAEALLAEALEAQGRLAEADRWTEHVDQSAFADDVVARVAWGVARAKALARATRLDEAERLAHEVLAVARETDALNMRAHASLALAQVLRQAGSKAEATSAAGEALALYEQKGNLVGAAQVEQFLAELRTVTTSASPGDPRLPGRRGAHQ
jgi:class 3 adenylate cyclase/tetratricopeptide (TPR) repeat protein